jgi:predicted RNA-binding protein YlqC (UPF0109 family)
LDSQKTIVKSIGYDICLYSGTENAVPSKTGIAMGKKIERFGELEIEWIGVPKVRLPCGDGVEFHYKTENHEKQSFNSRGDGKIIGFMEGLRWLDKEGHPVKVYFLSSNSKEWGKLISRAGKILHSLKECVFIVLEEKINPEQIWHGEIIKANIFTCWNC